MKYIRTISYYLSRLGFSFCHEEFYFYSLEAPVSAHAVNSKASIRICEIAKHNLRPEHILGWLTFDQALHLLSQDSNYFIAAFDNNEIVGSCFMETGDIDLDYLGCINTIPANSSYITHVIVKPGKRGFGIAQHLIGFVCAKSESIGRPAKIISCAKLNVSVQNTFSKLNFKKYLDVAYFKAPFVKVYFTKLIENNKTTNNSVSLSRRINFLDSTRINCHQQEPQKTQY